MIDVTKPGAVRQSQNMLFIVGAIVLTLIVFSGFIPSYWIPISSSSQSFPWFLHLHAFLFFGWVVLFLLQATLVAKNQVSIHRQVGMVGALWALAAIVTGLYMVIITTYRDMDLIDGSFGAVITFIPLSQVCMFTGFIALALVNIKRPMVHKRFMMLAALVAITPAIARLAITAIGGTTPVTVASIFLVSNGLIVTVAWYDAVRHHRLHPVFLYGGLVILFVRVLRVPFAMSPLWRSIAESLSNLVI